MHEILSITPTPISVINLPLIYNEVSLTGVTTDSTALSDTHKLIDRHIRTYEIQEGWYQVHFEQTTVNYVILYTFYKDNWEESSSSGRACSCCTGTMDHYRTTCGNKYKKGSKVEVLLGTEVKSVCGNWAFDKGTSLVSQTAQISCAEKPLGDSVKLTKTDSTRLAVTELRVVRYTGRFSFVASCLMELKAVF